jgi:hypothetical protein
MEKDQRTETIKWMRQVTIRASLAWLILWLFLATFFLWGAIEFQDLSDTAFGILALLFSAAEVQELRRAWRFKP